jgi:hypothetical protein
MIRTVTMPLPALSVFAAYFLLALLDYFTPTQALRAPLALWILLVIPGWSLLGFVRGIMRAERVALTFPVSVIFTSLYASALYRLVGNELFTLPYTTLAVLAIALLSLLSHRCTEQHPLAISGPARIALIRNHWPLWLVLILATVIHGINFLIYPFLSEADGYPLAATIQDAVAGHGTLFAYRPLFPALASILSSSSGVSVPTLFKYVFPLLLGAVFLYPYLTALMSGLRRWHLALATALPLTASVIVLEIDYTRPQVIIILLFFTVIWLLTAYLHRQNIALWYLALALSIVSIGFHEFGIFTVVPTLLVGIPLARDAWLKNRSLTIVWTIVALLLIYGYVIDTSITSLILNLSVGLWNNLADRSVTFWFINSYINSDGNNLGWPGWTASLYYGYNLGLLLPLALVYFLISWSRRGIQLVSKVAGYALIAPLLFAEILPRFNVAYLPDRIWLYLSIALCFLVIPAIAEIRSRVFFATAIGIALASLAVPALVTHLKQGWVDRPTHQAIMWIKENTLPDSTIITQGTNIPPLNLYAKRHAIFIPALFEARNASDHPLIKAANQEPHLLAGTEELAVIEERMRHWLERLITTQTSAERDAITLQLHTITANYTQSKDTLETFIAKDARSLYVLYSTTKFNGLYGQREWWRSYNAADADLRQFDSEHFKLMYDQQGVKIWKLVL